MKHDVKINLQVILMGLLIGALSSLIFFHFEQMSREILRIPFDFLRGMFLYLQG